MDEQQPYNRNRDAECVENENSVSPRELIEMPGNETWRRHDKDHQKRDPVQKIPREVARKHKHFDIDKHKEYPKALSRRRQCDLNTRFPETIASRFDPLPHCRNY
ncbi:MAG: hypothetical protein HKM95_07985 [Inquilinus sp.]|nr:hypothetical protein [Inquilinus sp.]